MASLEEMLAKAKQRASEVIESWIPKEGEDGNGGVIESIKFLSFQYDNNHRSDGLTASTVIRSEDGSAFRFNWMGTLPESTWEAVQPRIGDIVWIEHHGKREQKDGMNDYELVLITVIDPTTGEEREGTGTVTTESGSVDTETGEIKHQTMDERMELKDGEEAFGD